MKLQYYSIISNGGCRNTHFETERSGRNLEQNKTKVKMKEKQPNPDRGERIKRTIYNVPFHSMLHCLTQTIARIA